MTVYDWEQILKDEGEDVLAPSVMRLLDTSIDSEETFKRFVKVVTHLYGPPIDRDAELEAYRAAGRCDVATMNLVATNFTSEDQLDVLATALSRDYSVQAIRNFFILMLTTEADNVPKDRAITSSLIVARSKSPLLRKKKHSLRTEEGLEGQKALAHLVRSFYYGHQNRQILGKVITKSNDGSGAQFANEDLVQFVLEKPGTVDRVSAIIHERHAVDVDLIRETIASDTAALSSGVL